MDDGRRKSKVAYALRIMHRGGNQVMAGESDEANMARDYAAELNMSDQERQRLAKLQELRELGIDPYPPRSNRTHTSAEAIAELVEGEKSQQTDDRRPTTGDAHSPSR